MENVAVHRARQVTSPGWQTPKQLSSSSQGMSSTQRAACGAHRLVRQASHAGPAYTMPGVPASADPSAAVAPSAGPTGGWSPMPTSWRHAAATPKSPADAIAVRRASLAMKRGLSHDDPRRERSKRITVRCLAPPLHHLLAPV
jgi:hypothetical protein